MGKKADRITELERDIDELRTVVFRLGARITAMEGGAVNATQAVRKPSLVEQARQRAVELGDRVLEAVGF